MRALLLTILLCGVLSLPAQAAERCVVIHGGTAHFTDGTRVGTVTFRGSRITDLAEPSVADGCERIDASGKVVTAGLVEASSALGLTEVDLEKATVRPRVSSSPEPPMYHRSDSASGRLSDLPMDWRTN